MAYEKFIKKIFPFIGRKYRVPVEEDYSGYNKIEITGEVFLTAEDVLVGIDFKTGALEEYTESTLPDNVLYTDAKEIDEDTVEIGFSINTGSGVKSAFGNSITSHLPWPAIYRTSPEQTEITVSDIADITEDVFVVWHVDGAHFDLSALSSLTPEEIAAIHLATIYYK